MEAHVEAGGTLEPLRQPQRAPLGPSPGARALSNHSHPGQKHCTATFLSLGYSCIPAGQAAASFHWSALETEQERWCSPSGRLAKLGAPGGREGSGWRGGQGRGVYRLS